MELVQPTLELQRDVDAAMEAARVFQPQVEAALGHVEEVERQFGEIENARIAAAMEQIRRATAIPPVVQRFIEDAQRLAERAAATLAPLRAQQDLLSQLMPAVIGQLPNLEALLGNARSNAELVSYLELTVQPIVTNVHVDIMKIGASADEKQAPASEALSYDQVLKTLAALVGAVALITVLAATGQLDAETAQAALHTAATRIEAFGYGLRENNLTTGLYGLVMLYLAWHGPRRK